MSIPITDYDVFLIYLIIANFMCLIYFILLLVAYVSKIHEAYNEAHMCKIKRVLLESGFKGHFMCQGTSTEDDIES